MKTEKLSLGSIKNVLSRAEMKKIMAGSDSKVIGGVTVTCLGNTYVCQCNIGGVNQVTCVTVGQGCC